MPYYFPPLTADAAGQRGYLNSTDILQQVGQGFGQSVAGYAISSLIGLGETAALGPVGIVVDVVQAALFIVELFIAPTKIDIQKEVVEKWSEPLFRFVMLNYCLPQSGDVFRDLSSGDIQAVFDQRPDYRAFADTAYGQADRIVNADLGLQGYGGGMNQRLVNQWCGNAARHGWTVQQLIDTWQGVLNAAGVGPQPNGPPPADGPVARAIAGLQVGALLYHKWSDGQVLSDADWAFFSDYYVQTGFNMEADSPDTGVYWYTTWATHLQGNDPTIPQPATLYGPQAGGWFSPPCMTQPQPEPQPQPQPEPQPPPQPEPQPHPPPPQEQPYDQADYELACSIWRTIRSGGSLTAEESAFLGTTAGMYASYDSQYDTACYPGAPQPQPQPEPQPEPQPGPQPQPPSQTPYQIACSIWLTLRAQQTLTQAQVDWVENPANWDALAEAQCDPNCGYDPQQCPDPQPAPQPQPQPAPQDCAPDCQRQIDRLQDLWNQIPWQKVAELPDWERYIEQLIARCCQVQQTTPPPPFPQPLPQPLPGPQTGCPQDCQDQITDLTQVVNNWPQQVIQYVNNWYTTTIYPALEKLIIERITTLRRPLACLILRFCELGLAAWGVMAECWLQANTDEAGAVGDGVAYVDGVPTLKTLTASAAQRQSTGQWAEPVQIGRAMALRGLQDQIGGYAHPEADEIEGQPFIFTDVDPTTGQAEIRFPITLPAPDEPDPCAGAA